MKISRRDDIKEYIQKKGEVTLKELEHLFTQVSSMTLRRDLAFLEEKGFVFRTRGGAKSVSMTPSPGEDTYRLRASENIENKSMIAKRALSFIDTGRSFFIDSGTTTMCLAKIIPDTNLSIITTAPNIALEVIKRKNTNVTVVGGHLSRNNLSISGVNSTDFIRSINIDIAFMAASGFSIKSGFTVGNYDECELKKAIIKKADKVILMMDSSKVDKIMTFTFASIKDLDILISDNNFPNSFAEELQKNGIEILIT